MPQILKCLLIGGVLGAAGACWGCRAGAGGDRSAEPFERGGSGELTDASRVPEAQSLLATPLFRPQLEPASRARRDEELKLAWARYRQTPRDEGTIIWLGRRLAYLGRYHQAIAVYTDGLSRHPDSYKLLRHRGHRYLTVRRLDDAIADLDRARRLILGVPDEIEPDGLPNARSIPRSTSHSNIYYHLGLAWYLKGRFEQALAAYRRCLEYSANDDMRCATSYWLYLTLRRLGRDREAAAVLEPIGADMDIIENFTYQELLMMFKGTRSVPQVLGSLSAGSIDDATARYGVGAWHLVNGRRDVAIEIFRGIISGPSWPAFGYIAAEAELARSPAGAKKDRGSGFGVQGSGFDVHRFPEPRTPLPRSSNRRFALLSPSHSENADSPIPEPCSFLRGPLRPSAVNLRLLRRPAQSSGQIGARNRNKKAPIAVGPSTMVGSYHVCCPVGTGKRRPTLPIVVL